MKNTISVIITSGSTREKIDDLTDIVSKASGRTGAQIAETLLNADGFHNEIADRIDKIYYLSSEESIKPVVPGNWSGKLIFIDIKGSSSLLDELDKISQVDQNVKFIIHACIINDYKVRYEVTVHDLANELFDYMSKNKNIVSIQGIRNILMIPDTKSYHTDSALPADKIMIMHRTVDVAAHLRQMFPDAIIFNFGITCDAKPQALFKIAAKSLVMNNLDYVVAGNIISIGQTNRPVIVVGHDHATNSPAVIGEYSGTKALADAICDLVFNKMSKSQPIIEDCDGYWHVISANNNNTTISIEGSAKSKKEAWSIMLDLFKKDAAELLPELKIFSADMNSGLEYKSNDGCASITADGASIYTRSYVCYYNLIPVSYSNIT